MPCAIAQVNNFILFDFNELRVLVGVSLSIRP